MPCARTFIDDQNTLRRVPSGEFGWRPELLPSFTFLMSRHGVPVCASMMVGDAAYAREQLRLACTFDDQVLQQLAVQMLRPPRCSDAAFVAAPGNPLRRSAARLSA